MRAISLPKVLALIALMLAAAAFAPVRAAGPPAPQDLVRPSLVAEARGVAPGTVLWLDLRLETRPGWHTYWRNPGDAGLATAIKWDLPPGFSAGAIRWPVPRRIIEGGAGTYGYTGTVDLLVPVTAAKSPAPGRSATLTAAASWLVCNEICIPGSARLSLVLPVTAAPPPADPAVAPLFAAARRRLPAPAPFEVRFAVPAGDVRLIVPERALVGLRDPTGAFFPYGDRLIDNAGTPRVERRADGLAIVLEKSATAAAAPATLDGVLLLRGDGGGERAFEISANPLPPVPAETGPLWWQALLLAVLGGVVLNLMPCVFPILSLKILVLVGRAHGRRRERIAHGLAYTAGVILSFAALGGALLIARAAGQAVGWGFQLQSPVFVALIAYLLFAMGLGLSGAAVFGGFAAGLGGGLLAGRSGPAESFCTGVLASVVATPCTAPFMGAAIGFALLAPAPAALGIFLALGLGLAAPFLLTTLLPGLRRILPQPGAWMDLVKQILAFPLYLTVAWLVWVLIQEVGPHQSFAALLGLVLVGFAVWIFGQTRSAARRFRRLGSACAGVAALAALLAALSFVSLDQGAARADADSGSRSRLVYRPFSLARLGALEREKKPVFVNLTAAWCLTCLVNERTALDDNAVEKAFAARGIVPLKGDWTSGNPEITGFLQRFGRNGVPLYLYYDGARPPVVLPQLLTAAIVLDTIGKT
jgi:thiol:disulfide interchange protein/DsbC/DsbD-like thiol-disulfide interchange protein